MTQEQITKISSSKESASSQSTTTWNDLVPKTTDTIASLQEDGEINVITLEAESRLKFYED